MLNAHRFFACASALAAALAAASCSGSAATAGSAPIEDGGLLDAGAADREPPPPACSAPKTVCGSACVDTSSDTKNCGRCGTGCNGAELCVAGSCTIVAGFAARKIYLGETDRTGMPVAQAWKAYGRNIDGIISVAGVDNGECRRIAGASSSSAADGNNGIDNAWGKTVLGFILGLQPTPTKSTNQLIEGGARTLMLKFAEPPKQTGSAPFALVSAENTFALKWDGSDSRPIAESSTTGGKPRTVFAVAAMAGGVLTSGVGSAPFALSFNFGGAALDIPIRLPQVSLKISVDGKTGSEGTISGVVDTEEMVASIEKSAGFISTQLCGGSTLDTIKQVIRQASDILVDGTQDPTKDCNAISIGIGFDAVAVAVGPVAGPVGPAKDPCLP